MSGFDRAEIATHFARWRTDGHADTYGEVYPGLA